MSKLLVIVMLATSSISTIAFANNDALERALIKMNRAQLLLDEAKAEVEAALDSNLEPQVLTSTVTGSYVVPIQCNQTSGNNNAEVAIQNVVNNLSAQCRGIRACGRAVNEQDIAFTFRSEQFDCHVTGTLYY